MKRRVRHEKDPVAFKGELTLHIISKGFCYHWKTEGQAGSLGNREVVQE